MIQSNDMSCLGCGCVGDDRFKTDTGARKIHGDVELDSF